MSPAPASCEEKTRLLHDHSIARSDYRRALMLLREQSGVMSKRDYDAIRVFAEKARELADQARAALDKHIADHGC